MTVYVEHFPGPALAGGWNAATGGGGDITVDGRCNFNAYAAVDGSGNPRPVHSLISRTFTGDLGDGYVRFWAGMPAVVVPSGSPRYMFAEPRLNMTVDDEGDPYRFIYFEIFVGNPSFSPIGDNGYTVRVNSRYAPAAPAPEADFAYDATRPFFKLLFGAGTVTVQNSTDGAAYATITTLTSGTVPFASDFFSVAFDAYEDTSQLDLAPWTIQLDDVEVGYTGVPGPSATATARWNTARLNLVGAAGGQRTRFAPRPVI